MRRFYELMLNVDRALAVIAGALLAFITLLVALDVTIRTAGLQPPAWTVSVTEYTLLYVTMLGAPYLVRLKAHVFVEALIVHLPPRLRWVIEKLVYLAAAALSLFLAYYALKAGITGWRTGDFDLRAFEMPRWALYLPIMVGFLLTGIEFVRYLITSDSMYTRRQGPADGL